MKSIPTLIISSLFGIYPGLIISMPMGMTSLVDNAQFSIGSLSFWLLVVMIAILPVAVYWVLSKQKIDDRFLQFLAPQIRELISRQGLHSAMRERQMNITAVFCDLRGYTRFSENTDSSQVMEMLREYYATIDWVADRFGGLVKDRAGDGILILVGAPVSMADHRKRGLRLAKALRDEVSNYLVNAGYAQRGLGVGIGLATGEVTVSILGEGARLEYTAVGRPVNLAARLSGAASHREIRVAPLDDDNADESHMEYHPIALKGFDEPVSQAILS